MERFAFLGRFARNRGALLGALIILFVAAMALTRCLSATQLLVLRLRSI